MHWYFLGTASINFCAQEKRAKLGLRCGFTKALVTDFFQSKMNDLAFVMIFTGGGGDFNEGTLTRVICWTARLLLLTVSGWQKLKTLPESCAMRFEFDHAREALKIWMVFTDAFHARLNYFNHCNFVAPSFQMTAKLPRLTNWGQFENMLFKFSERHVDWFLGVGDRVNGWSVQGYPNQGITTFE